VRGRIRRRRCRRARCSAGDGGAHGVERRFAELDYEAEIYAWVLAALGVPV
jgi:hypothetical protein